MDLPIAVSRLDRAFSINGLETTRIVVGWVMFDFASSCTAISYGIVIPLLVNLLGDTAFGDGKGKVLWAYLTVVISVIVALLYISFTAVIEYGNIKRKGLVRCGAAAAIFLILFIFCFASNSVYLACVLVVCSICCQRVADVSYDSLLDAVSKKSVSNSSHQVSSRGSATGYLGIISFVIVLAPILGVIYILFNPGNLWIQGIIPTVASGIWYLIFLRGSSVRLPVDVSTGPPVPDKLRGNSLPMFLLNGIKEGFLEQMKTVKSMPGFPDLSFFILGMIFISDAASSATSSAVIVASDSLGLSIIAIGGAALVGIVAAVIGLLFYRWVESHQYLTPKQILIWNVLVICGAGVYVMFVTNIWEVFLFCIIGGSQIGSISAFSRSILSKMLPKERQTRFFSFYDFTQKGSAWIGPLIVGAVTDSFGSSKYLTIVIAVSLVEAAIGLPFLLYVNPARGEAVRAVVEAATADQERQSAMADDEAAQASTTLSEQQKQANGTRNGDKGPSPRLPESSSESI